jgi:hypothetical protein
LFQVFRLDADAVVNHGKTPQAIHSPGIDMDQRGLIQPAIPHCVADEVLEQQLKRDFFSHDRGERIADDMIAAFLNDGIQIMKRFFANMVTVNRYRIFNWLSVVRAVNNSRPRSGQPPGESGSVLRSGKEKLLATPLRHRSEKARSVVLTLGTASASMNPMPITVKLGSLV